MKPPDKRQRHQQDQNIRQDIRRRDITIKGLLVKTGPSHNRLVPGIRNRRALKDSREKNPDAVAEHECTDDIGKDLELGEVEDADEEQED